VDLRILGLHLERLADIALTPLERGTTGSIVYADRSAARSNCANVCFRFAEARASDSNNVNLCVAPGQFVTIMDLRCGKTTLSR